MRRGGQRMLRRSQGLRGKYLGCEYIEVMLRGVGAEDSRDEKLLESAGGVVGVAMGCYHWPAQAAVKGFQKQGSYPVILHLFWKS